MIWSFSYYINGLIPHTHPDFSGRLALAAANATKQWGGGGNEDSSSSRLKLLAAAFLAAVRRERTSTAKFHCNLPPKTTGAARGNHFKVTRRLAAFAPRVPHVGLPCDALRVAGESGDEAWASFKIHCFRKVQPTPVYLQGFSRWRDSLTTQSVIATLPTLEPWKVTTERRHQGNPEEISWSVEQTNPRQGSCVRNSVAHTTPCCRVEGKPENKKLITVKKMQCSHSAVVLTEYSLEWLSHLGASNMRHPRKEQRMFKAPNIINPKFLKYNLTCFK